MTTKDQERKALEQIRKIVAGLGEESYIGKAFEGCFERAHDNIDNDFWNSPADAIASLHYRLDEANREADAQRKMVQELKQELQEANEDAQEWKKQYDRMHDKATDYANKATENWNNFREQEDKVEALELENMKLKAKLYDMMVGA